MAEPFAVLLSRHGDHGPETKTIEIIAADVADARQHAEEEQSGWHAGQVSPLLKWFRVVLHGPESGDCSFSVRARDVMDAKRIAEAQSAGSEMHACTEE